jgi:NAD(P)-dependent dehydrogenase (short-subunit alcohol dehydrogenase family)
MTTDLQGKSALITGAARGLGLSLAEKLAAEGVNICGVDLRADPLQVEMQRIKDVYAIKSLALEADIAVEAQVISLVKHVIDEWSNIDILINNAGIRKVGAINEVEEEMWDDIHDSNLKGQFLCTREVLRQDMLERNVGTIIFISSDAAKEGSKGSSAYAASKWGGLGFAASLAKDLKHTNIRTSSIIPGRIWTPMAEESEAATLDIDWLDPQYVADAVLFCIRQSSNTIIPELQIYHRSQI